MFLSMIIPVYNCEKYISACLESCLSQDLPKDKYEIILVDDGSSDASMQVVRSFMEIHRNIHLFAQEHQGDSATRNHGIKETKGDYCIVY